MTEINDRSAAEMPAKRKDPAETDKAVAEAIDPKKAAKSDWWMKPENFLAGATPLRQTVIIYGDLVLHARISELAKLEPKLPPKEARLAKAEATQLTTRLLESAMPVVIGAKDSEWVANFRSDLERKKVKDDVEVGLRQLAAQIVEPEGITVEWMREVIKVQETDSQISKMLATMFELNERVPIVNPRFLA